MSAQPSRRGSTLLSDRWNGATSCAVMDRFQLLSLIFWPVTGLDKSPRQLSPRPGFGWRKRVAPLELLPRAA